MEKNNKKQMKTETKLVYICAIILSITLSMLALVKHAQTYKVENTTNETNNEVIQYLLPDEVQNEVKNETERKITTEEDKKEEENKEDKKETTSRSSDTERKTTTTQTKKTTTTTKKETNNNGEWQKFTATAYCPCAQCCGKTNGITASGAKAKAGVTVAMSSKYAFGTKIEIKGMGTYIVQDRGGAIGSNRIDIFFNTHQEALNFGRKTVYLRVVE